MSSVLCIVSVKVIKVNSLCFGPTAKHYSKLSKHKSFLIMLLIVYIFGLVPRDQNRKQNMQYCHDNHWNAWTEKTGILMKKDAFCSWFLGLVSIDWVHHTNTEVSIIRIWNSLIIVKTLLKPLLLTCITLVLCTWGTWCKEGVSCETLSKSFTVVFALVSLAKANITSYAKSPLSHYS